MISATRAGLAVAALSRRRIPLQDMYSEVPPDFFARCSPIAPTDTVARAAGQEEELSRLVGTILALSGMERRERAKREGAYQLIGAFSALRRPHDSSITQQPTKSKGPRAAIVEAMA